MTVISIAAEKGGVGKTATAVHLATGLATKKRRVLLIDLDSQGHASYYVGARERNAERFVSALLSKQPLSPVKTEYKVDLLEGGRELAILKTELPKRPDGATLLRDALRPLRDLYDLIFIDTPPELGLTTMNALAASDYALIPVQCQGAALLGMDDVMDTIEEVRDVLNPSLTILGIIPTMAQTNTLLTQQVLDALQAGYEGIVSPEIRNSIAVAESLLQSTPIYQYDTKNNAATDYRRVCTWLKSRLKEERS